MNEQEAIKYLELAFDNSDGEDLSDLYKDMCRKSIEALEKQIPKKPIQPFGTHSYKCPVCYLFVAHEVSDNCDLENEMAEWCPYCGQKLDWSE